MKVSVLELRKPTRSAEGQRGSVCNFFSNKGRSADTAFTWRGHAGMDFSSVMALGKVTLPLHPLRPTNGGAVVGTFKKNH